MSSKEDKKEIITVPNITNYEKAAIISIRAEQISNGSPSMYDSMFDTTSRRSLSKAIDIARYEWDNGLIPLKIERILPDESSVIIDLIINNKKG